MEKISRLNWSSRWVIEMSEIGYGQTHTQVCEIIKILDQTGKKTPIDLEKNSSKLF